MRYWLLKTEPDVFSFDDLENSPEQTTGWEGVRNYQARNNLREMRVGDRVLIYHSSINPPGIVGTARIVREAYADGTQFNPQGDYFDPKSTPESPRWSQVDVQADQRFARFLPLEQLKLDTKLEGMVLLQRGSRLSVQPVSKSHWTHILKLGGIKDRS